MTDPAKPDCAETGGATALSAGVARMVEQNVTLSRAVLEFARYFWVEMDWENFRAEFLSKDGPEYTQTRKNNAKAMASMLNEISARSPELRTLIMEARKS